MKFKLLLGIGLLVLFGFVIGCSEQTPADLSSFATCLTEAGAKLYGASWCPHCHHQKEMFGTAVSKIDYTECTTDKVKCTEAEIQALPTWKFADGTAVTGTQSLTVLADKTGCKLE